ncbi:hypothetical protein Tco_0081683, partial [Tanacetum coccineum]
MATSSTEAEYVAATNCCGQTHGLRGSSIPSGVTRVPTGSLHFSYWSGTTTATPSSPVRDARKGKGVAV